MSQSLHIFDTVLAPSERPSTPQALMKIIERLEAMEPGQNPKFVALAQALQQRFPTAKEMEQNGEDPEDCVWVSEPLGEAESVTTAVWNFGLPPNGRAEVTVAVVELAGPLGLAVYDDQIGIGFLPGDRIIPASARDEWEDEVEEVRSRLKPTLKQAFDSTYPSIAELMQRHGFVSNEEKLTPAFSRDVESGKQSVQFFFRAIYDEFRYTLYLSGSDGLMGRICERAEVKGFNQPLYNLGHQVTEDAELGNGIPVNDAEDLKRMLGILKEKVLPLADRLGMLRGIHDFFRQSRWFRGDPQLNREPNRSGLVRLMTAYLFDSDFIREVQEHRQWASSHPAELREQMIGNVERVIAYMQANVTKLI